MMGQEIENFTSLNGVLVLLVMENPLILSLASVAFWKLRLNMSGM